ncbi:hypothetical protein ILUMI_20697 [Ignelater luminosus]|uniref:Uncharacterized protein n=1 Tax=Ignelater luminosus TaxID=2038154 RepID=A0A8K0CFX5_IGNLU|nr:hypothetical protein ILUMI_20697 [Ignelater luminosus]
MAAIIETATQMLNALDQAFRIITENPAVRSLAKHQQGAGHVPAKEVRKHKIRWEEVNSAFQSRIRTGVIVNLKHFDPLTFLEDTAYMFTIRIKNALKVHHHIKVNVVFCGLFEKESPDVVVEEVKHFPTPNAVIDGDTDLQQWWSERVQDTNREGGWALKSILNLAVNRYEPIRGASHVTLPLEIAKKHACINIKNVDEACFAWVVVSALHPVEKDPQRITSYPHYSAVLNTEGLRFPMTVDEVRRSQNNANDVTTTKKEIFLISKEYVRSGLEFSKSFERIKRRIIELLCKTIKTEKLAFATQLSLRSSRALDAAKIGQLQVIVKDNNCITTQVLFESVCSYYRSITELQPVALPFNNSGDTYVATNVPFQSFVSSSQVLTEVQPLLPLNHEHEICDIPTQYSGINNATKETLDDAVSTVSEKPDPYATDDDSDYYPNKQENVENADDLVEDEERAEVSLDNVGQEKKSVNKITRKKTINVRKWKKTVIKSRRNSGKQYKNWKNNFVPERNIKPHCTEKFNWEKDTSKEKVRWNQVKVIYADPTIPFVLQFKYTFLEKNFSSINLLEEGRKRIKLDIVDKLKQLRDNLIPLLKVTMKELMIEVSDVKSGQREYMEHIKEIKEENEIMKKEIKELRKK